MSTTTTNYGLIKPDTTDPILIGQLNDNADIIDATLKSLSDVLDVAKLGIKYKGEVNYYSNLPASGNEIGDAYTVKYAGSSGTTPDGTEYVWGTVSGTNQWINFSKDSYSKAEVDALLSLKANIADIPTPSTAAPAMDGTAAAGTSTDYARADHVHPSDTSRASAAAEAEDRAALVELVDGGAKNIASANTLSASIGGVTCTQDANDKNIISLAGTNTSAITAYIWGSSSSPLNITVNEDYYIAAAERSTNIIFALSYVDSEGTTRFAEIPSIGYVIPTGSTIRNIYVQQNATNKTIDFSVKLMICSKVAWDISQAYQPYRPSYQELYDMVKALQPAT